MKKRNIWHNIWLIGVYVILLIILYLVVEYKVKWEGRDLNTYMYFYNCSNNLCTSTTSQTDYYGRVKCEDDVCPFIKEKQDNLLILSSNNKEYIYDYINNKTINDSYKTYHFSNDYIIVSNKDGKYGVISEVGEVVKELKYDSILDYKNGFMVILANNKKGIKNEEKNIEIKPTYDDIILINDSTYSYKEDNKYYIASYNSEIPVNNTNYSYVYAIDDTNILVIKDKKLDIIDNNLKSRLILKLDTYYEYDGEGERNSLNIVREGTLLKFSLVTDKDNNITNYIYDIKNKKLYE